MFSENSCYEHKQVQKNDNTKPWTTKGTGNITSIGTVPALEHQQRMLSQSGLSPFIMKPWLTPANNLRQISFIPTPILLPNVYSANRNQTSLPKMQHPPKLPSDVFYGTYHGHPPTHIKALIAHITTPKLYLAGDSTLDNKHWLPSETHPATPPYNTLLSPPVARRDLAYWLTTLAPPTLKYIAVNCAVEESTLSMRRRELTPQDAVLRDNISSEDILVISAGGNDVALAPTVSTGLAVLANVYLGGRIGIPTLEALFVRGAEQYIGKLVAKTRPRMVVLCGLYYLDEAVVPSWAGGVLRLLGYNSRPERVQRVVDRVFEGLKGVHVDGVEVVPVALSEALNGKETADYVARVEPSERGGEKIARLIWRTILRHDRERM